MSDATNKENSQKTGENSSSTASTSSTWSMTETSVASSASASSVPAASTPAPSAASAGAPDASGSGASNRKRNRIIAGIIIVIVAIAVCIGISFALGGGFYDNASKEGQAPYKTDDEIQAEIDRSVEDGMLNISIASIIEFADGTSSGTAYIENVPSNKYVMKVTITLDDNDEVVYESGGIKPDSYIETIELKKDLDAGTYPATATFTAYEPDSLEEVGQAAAKITLVVNG